MTKFINIVISHTGNFITVTLSFSTSKVLGEIHEIGFSVLVIKIYLDYYLDYLFNMMIRKK